MDFQAKWIQISEDIGSVCPVFRKTWSATRPVDKAELLLTALGVYEAELNSKRVGNFILAPGWTSYDKRIQYQVYDVTDQIQQNNTLTILLGKGWYSSPMPGWNQSADKLRRQNRPNCLLGELHLHFKDGSTEVLPTDESWLWSESNIRFSEIYDGERCDMTLDPTVWKKVSCIAGPTDLLIPQEGEIVCEQERLQAKRILTTPSGETVVDFGQEITGYVEFTITAHRGDHVRLLHGEVLDKQGNFYHENYRSAKAELHYVCQEGTQTWHPHLTFFGFRYIKLVEYPGTALPEQFTAIAVYSNIRRTGHFICSDPALNQLYSNILWSQKDNFLDVPTDCPQRDERLGWTGDAQVFVKAASYNFDVERFFRKWLHDIIADQRADGSVGQVIPDYMPEELPSAGWGDAAVICPWQIFETYGDSDVLADQFDSMKKWVNYITVSTTTPGLWTGGTHFGDWLGLDAPQGSYKGSTREDFIATAFYAYSTSLVIRAGKVLGKDIKQYETLYGQIIKEFRKTFPDYKTQTECVLAAQFGLAEDVQAAADQLGGMIRDCNVKMQTGFIGTPYLLPVLSRYGHNDLAYQLLLRRSYPSWLYSVDKGATTIWEHWDGIMESGDFWSTDMNSFNHYAYGAVADWLYETAAGIRPAEPGFSKVIVAPQPNDALEWLEASLQTRHGLVFSRWIYKGKQVLYEIKVDMPATIVINGVSRQVQPGEYIFWG